MEEAEAQLYRRIQELRTRARGERRRAADRAAAGIPRPVPDLRTILARAESHVDDLRATAAALEETLPAKVERAVERAMASHPDGRSADELRDCCAACRGRSSRSTATCWPSGWAGSRTWSWWST